MKCKCKICKEQWNYGSSISPMLIDKTYEKVLNYYKIKNTKKLLYVINVWRML